MKTRSVRRMLATALAVSMLVAPATVFATDSAGSSSNESSSSGAAATTSVAAGGTISVAGTTITSTSAGVSTVQSVAAVAVTEPGSAVAADLGLGSGERAYASSYDITPASSPAAMASINGAAGAVGGTVIGSFNLNIGKMTQGGRYVAADGSVRVQTTVAIPARAIDPNKNYAMIVVSPGGATRLEQDQDTNPRTVTFAANGGLGAYALISY